MTQYWIVYDSTTGAEWFRGSGPDGAFAMQQPPEGAALIEVPGEAIQGATSLALIRQFYAARVDAEAEAFRCRFITAGSGQAITYIWKAQEATAFLADENADVPFLEAEATALGMTVADLAAEVAAATAQWGQIGKAIEARRRAAKKSISDAADFAALTAAATVDWNALTD